MNVRSSNDVSCCPAFSEVDSNYGNPCSLVGNSLFSKSGNTPGGAPKSDPITEAASPGSPDFGVFPCIFPANQGFAPRDEFATDCTLRHLVRDSGEFVAGARSDGEFPALSRGFGRDPKATRTGDFGGTAIQRLRPTVFSVAGWGGSGSHHRSRAAGRGPKGKAQARRQFCP
jgi:hypothetical protein